MAYDKRKVTKQKMSDADLTPTTRLTTGIPRKVSRNDTERTGRWDGLGGIRRGYRAGDKNPETTDVSANKRKGSGRQNMLVNQRGIRRGMK